MNCAREYPIDLAVVDLGLPEMDGIELIVQLRRQGISFPILIPTARTRFQLAEPPIRAWFTSPKPTILLIQFAFSLSNVLSGK